MSAEGTRENRSCSSAILKAKRATEMLCAALEQIQAHLFTALGFLLLADGTSFTNRSFVAAPCGTSLLATFFQKHLETDPLCLWVTF